MTSSDPVRVDIVSDVVCPWCLVGFLQLQAACAERQTGAVVFWHPFELNPQMPPEGQDLREHIQQKYGTTPEQSQQARQHLSDVGAALGFRFTYGEDMRMWNTFLAHQAIHWAGTLGQAHQMKMALFAAYFTNNRRIGDIDVLVDVATEIGLDGAALAEALTQGTHAQEVRTELDHWVGQGITGVPAMIFDGKFLVTGAQGPENYAKVLDHVEAQRAA